MKTHLLLHCRLTRVRGSPLTAFTGSKPTINALTPQDVEANPAKHANRTGDPKRTHGPREADPLLHYAGGTDQALV